MTSPQISQRSTLEILTNPQFPHRRDKLPELPVLGVRIAVDEGEGPVGLQRRLAVVLGASSSGTKNGGLSTLEALTNRGVVGVAEAIDGAGEIRAGTEQGIGTS